jgi:hypothetical protein
MFNELVDATLRMIQNPNFVPYHPLIYHQGNHFEPYINRLLIDQLGPNFLHGNIPGNGPRQFDIKRQINDIWEVCEIGHQKSSNGYLQNIPGLMNKIFDQYRMNYSGNLQNITSYTLLYFTLEPQYIINEVNTMFNTMMNLFPNKNIARLPVIHENELKGQILIIDSVENEQEAINIYRQNPHVHQYLRNIPQHWN